MLRVIGFLLAATLFFSGGIWAGYWVKESLEIRTSLPFRIQYKIIGFYNSLLRADETTVRTISTNRLDLSEETVFLPIKAADYAGGISAYGGTSILLLDRLGHFFYIDGFKVEELALSPPDNHIFQLKQQLKDGKLGTNVDVDFKWFRYNDVLYVKFDKKAFLLASYTEWQSENICFNSTLALLELPANKAPGEWRATPTDWKVVKRTSPCLEPFEVGKAIKALEAGGRLAHEKNSTVLWTSGAYERDDFVEGPNFSKALAQDDSTDYGKILRVNFLSGESEKVAKGLRNPQGISIDSKNQIWVSDHGMRGGDELNLVKPDANFGYPAVTYGTKYNHKPAGNLPQHANHDGYDHPVIAFVPSIAPGAIVAVENFHYTWNGDILVGAYNGSMYRVHMEPWGAAYVEPIELGVRTRDIVLLENGKIAIWTDDRRIVYLSVSQQTTPLAGIESRLSVIKPKHIRDEVEAVFKDCLQCHSLNKDEHGIGPSLWNICKTKPGNSTFTQYSGALHQIRGTWSTESLANFISDPQRIAPGTTMGWGGIENRQIAAELSELLCQTK